MNSRGLKLSCNERLRRSVQIEPISTPYESELSELAQSHGMGHNDFV